MAVVEVELGAMIRGDRRNIDFTLFESDGVTPLDLTGMLLWWDAKRDASDADADALIVKTWADAGIDVPNPLLGTGSVLLTAADTLALPRDAQILVWGLRRSAVAGDPETLATGTLTVLPSAAVQVP